MKTSQNILKNIVKKLLESDGKLKPNIYEDQFRKAIAYLDEIIFNLEKSSEQPWVPIIRISKEKKDFIANFILNEGYIIFSDPDLLDQIKDQTNQKDPSYIIGQLNRLKTKEEYHKDGMPADQEKYTYTAQNKDGKKIDTLIGDLIILSEFLKSRVKMYESFRNIVKTIIKEELSKKKEKNL
jgi:hypothetical protein